MGLTQRLGQVLDLGLLSGVEPSGAVVTADALHTQDATAAFPTTASLRRAAVPDGDDIVARTFASDDFHHGVAAFLAKEKPAWTGR